MKHSDQQKQKIISLYPFPIGYVYQKLAVHAKSKQENLYEEELSAKKMLWFILQNVNILLKLVGTISMSDYLANRYRFMEPEINSEILNHMSNVSIKNWFKVISILSSQVPIEDRTIPELATLKTPMITISDTTADIITSFEKEREYSWLELMAEFIKLQDTLQTGLHKLTLPSKEVLEHYIFILEKAYLHCDFLQKYGIYVLISKDERKTRGFLCCGTKSKAIGIRGISNEKWHIYKGRPFMSYKQNQNISLFPYIVPWVQKIGSKTGFSDLLLLENISNNSLFYYSYRYNRTVSHEECTTNALFFVQKDLRWLEENSSKNVATKRHDVSNFHHLLFDANWQLENIQKFYQKLMICIDNNTGQYLHVSSPSGTGKTTTVLALYHFDKKQKLGTIIKDSPHRTYPFFMYYFCAVRENYISKIECIKSIYAQVLENIFNLPLQKAESRAQKLPYCFNTLTQNLEELLWKADREILQEQNRKIVILIDGLSLHKDFFTIDLPGTIFFVFFFDANKNTATPEPLHSLSSIFPKPTLSILNQVMKDCSLNLETQQLIATKSQGSILYAKLYCDAYKKNYLSLQDEIPDTLDALLDTIWKKLPEDHDFIAYKILIIAAIANQYISDAMIVEMFSSNRDTVYKIRYEINIFLSYHEKQYTIAHPYYRNYIISSLSKYDKKIYFEKIASYYDCFTSSGTRDSRNIQKEGLWDLAYYYKESRQLEKVMEIVSDKLLHQEKIKYFKTHEAILHDITIAMEESYQKALWENILQLSFQYCQVEIESMKGISQTFRYAESGDYLSAIARAKAIKNEILFFQTLLFILLCAIDNKDDQKADLVFDELEKLPDYQINYIAEGLEPLVLFVLKKVADCGLLPIHTILGKHGLQGTDAVSHLLDLQTQVNFSDEQLKIFLGHLIHTSAELKSEQEKHEVITEIVTTLHELGSFSENKDIWDLLAKFIHSFENVLLKMECTIAVAQKLSSINNISYLHHFMEDFSQKLETLPAEDTITLRSKYSILINFVGDEEQAKYHLEKVLLSVQPLAIEFQYKAYREILSTIKRIGNFSSMRIYWKRLLLVAKEEVHNTMHESFLSELCIYFADLEKWEHVFDLFKQISSLKSDFRANTLIQISENLKDIPTNALPFWEIILEQTKYLSNHRQRVKILQNVADGLFLLGTLPSDMIWRTYLSLCSLLKDIGHDEDKNKVLCYLACKMADNGHGRNAHKIISRLSSPAYRSRPLSRIVIHDLSASVWDSLKLAEEIFETADLFQVFITAAEIWNKKQNKILEKKFLELLENTIKSQRYNYYVLAKIFDLLLIPKQIELNKNVWHTALQWIHYLEEKDKKNILKKYLDKLGLVTFFEHGKFLWIDIYALVQKITCDHEKSYLYAQIANIFIYWDQVQEASKNLLFAEQYASSENLKNRLDALVNIANIYRKIGNEKKSNELLKNIIENSEYSEQSLQEKYAFVAKLYDLNLADFAKDLMKNIILPYLNTVDETPSTSIIFSIIDLSLRAKQKTLAHNLFFQTLPILYKDTKSTESNPNYSILCDIFEKMKDDEEVLDMWKYAEGITLNFTKQNLQEKYVESLANALLKLGSYKKNKALWEKLITDCRYIGKDGDTVKTLAHIGKVMLTVAPWQDFVDSFDYILEIIDSLPSEYEKLTAFDHISSIVIASENFNIKSDVWQNLESIPTRWNKEECQNLAYMNLCKSLSSNANAGVKRIFFTEVERIVHKITKAQQICETLLFVTDSFLKNNMHNEVLRTLENTIENGKVLGKFYYSNILPKIVELFIDNKNFDLAELHIKDIPQLTKKIMLLISLASTYQKHDKLEDAEVTYKNISSFVEQLPTTSGDSFKMNVAVWKYAQKYCVKDTNTLLKNSFASWNQIESDLLKKEAIDFAVSMFDDAEIKNIPIEIWQKFITIAKNIEHIKYRSWSMETIANVLLPYHQTLVKNEILDAKNIEQETFLKIGQKYIQEASGTNSWEEIEETLSLFPKEEQQQIVYHLTETLSSLEDEQKLFLLLLKFPGNFHLTSFIIKKILHVAFVKRDEEEFLKWLKITLESWKIN